jgi:hypothetical protein
VSGCLWLFIRRRILYTNIASAEFSFPSFLFIRKYTYCTYSLNSLRRNFHFFIPLLFFCFGKNDVIRL